MSDDLQPAAFGTLQSAGHTQEVIDRAERLREVIRSVGREHLASIIGVHPQSLTRYMGGREVPTSTLVAIAQAGAVSVEWLATGRGQRRAGVDGSDSSTNVPGSVLPDTEKSRYVAIPRLNIAASAGYGALAEHAQVVEYLAFDVDFVRSRLRRDPKNLVLIEARGDSMEPTIRNGDILTVDLTPDQPLAHAHLYILRVDNDLMVKRLERRLDGALIVSSDNPRYKSEMVEREQLNTLEIIGQVLLVSAPPR